MKYVGEVNQESLENSSNMREMRIPTVLEMKFDPKNIYFEQY